MHKKPLLVVGAIYRGDIPSWEWTIISFDETDFTWKYIDKTIDNNSIHNVSISLAEQLHIDFTIIKYPKISIKEKLIQINELFK